MAKLELMDTATSRWLPLPCSGGGGDDDDDEDKNEDDDYCPACGLPMVAIIPDCTIPDYIMPDYIIP